MTCFLHWREFFYLNQNNRVWTGSKKADVKRLLSERDKFAQHVMVSADVCFVGKGRLHFVDESAKVDSAYYVGRLLPSLVDDCTRLLPSGSGYIFQQDGAPAHTARATQNWLQTNYPDFIAKDQWPPNSPDLNPLDYHVWRQFGGLSQAPSETENNRRTEGSPAGDLGQPNSATNRQSCQRVLKATKGLCCSWWWTFRTFTVTAMPWLCYFCLNDVILLPDYLDIFERAKIAIWQHCNADNFWTLLANYVLVRLLCAHEMTKHVCKISHLNFNRLLRKLQKMLGGYFICRTLYMYFISWSQFMSRNTNLIILYMPAWMVNGMGPGSYFTSGQVIYNLFRHY